MSLRAFHIIFVSVCTVLCAFLALWGFVISEESSLLADVMATVGLAGVVGMPIYGVVFYRKASRIHL